MVDEKKFAKMLRREPGRLSVSAKKFGFGIRHVQMICMSFCMIALYMARSSLGVAILAMTDVSRKNDTNVEVYNWDKKTQGLILSSFFWGYMTMQIPAGLLAKKYGGKPILLVALLANGSLCVLLPTVASLGGWPMICLCRVLMGLTQACLFPASHTLLGRWLPANERTTLAGVVYGGAQMGTIIAMPVSGVLAETAMGWKLIFYATGGSMFVTAGLWFWFSASSPEEHPMMSEEEKYYIDMGLNMSTAFHMGNRPTPWKEMLKTGPLWAITVSHIANTVAFVLFFVDLPTYLEMAMQISLKNSALLSALPYFGMWVGSIASSIICEKIYNRGLLSIGACRKIFNSLGLFGTGAGLIVLAFMGPEHKNIAIATVVALLTMCGCTSAGFMVNHLDLSPHFAGVMLSITNFAGSIGSILTPVGTSLILRNDSSDISSWRIVFLATSAICVSANIIYLIFGSGERQPWDRPDWGNRNKSDAEEIRPVLTMKHLNVEEQEKTAEP